MYSVYVRVYACARELGWKSKEGSGGESVARQLACLGPPPICARAGVLNLSGRRAPDNVSMHGITRRRSSLSFLALYSARRDCREASSSGRSLYAYNVSVHVCARAHSAAAYAVGNL